MKDEYFYGHGKLLLTGEYFVLDGATSIALPLKVGQSMKVRYRHSYQPTLSWKSLDHKGDCWFESEFELWHFKPLNPSGHPTQTFVSKVLSAARSLNPHFLRDECDVLVETKIEFPLKWGLGSSSTFLYNVAQWAYVSPFELLKRTMGGSGYDIACAQAIGPITYKKIQDRPEWESVAFNPNFKDQIYFIYLGHKQVSRQEIIKFREMKIEDKDALINDISGITQEMISVNDLRAFERLINLHEELISSALKYEKVKDLYFSDYWGSVKSLGAWGGDFVLATSNRSPEETSNYFKQKGFDTVISYKEIVISEPTL